MRADPRQNTFMKKRGSLGSNKMSSAFTRDLESSNSNMNSTKKKLPIGFLVQDGMRNNIAGNIHIGKISHSRINSHTNNASLHSTSYAQYPPQEGIIGENVRRPMTSKINTQDFRRFGK